MGPRRRSYSDGSRCTGWTRLKLDAHLCAPTGSAQPLEHRLYGHVLPWRSTWLPAGRLRLEIAGWPGICAVSLAMVGVALVAHFTARSRSVRPGA
jgi:hypothetical protein